jgi:preprotein translocase SecE subunit
LTRLRRFIAEAYSELKKVTWPTGEQTRNLTVLVFTVSLVVGIVITALDAFFQNVVGILAELG